MTCQLCRQSKEPGWLCAEHPGQPWEHDGCGAEGAPCACNPSGLVRWRQAHADAGTGERDTAEAIHRMLAAAQATVAPGRRLSYPTCYGGPVDLAFILTCYRCRRSSCTPAVGRPTACTRRSASAATAKSLGT